MSTKIKYLIGLGFLVVVVLAYFQGRISSPAATDPDLKEVKFVEVSPGYGDVILIGKSDENKYYGLIKQVFDAGNGSYNTQYQWLRIQHFEPTEEAINKQQAPAANTQNEQSQAEGK